MKPKKRLIKRCCVCKMEYEVRPSEYNRRKTCASRMCVSLNMSAWGRQNGKLTPNKRLPDHLIRLRVERGLSYGAIAELAGVSQSTAWRWINRERYVRGRKK